MTLALNILIGVIYIAILGSPVWLALLWREGPRDD